MTPKEFNSLVTNVQTECLKVLYEKEKQYGSKEDRLIQFKVAAGLTNKSQVQALGGMMAKHTTKLYMMMDDTSGFMDTEAWDEVITDHINYLYLLKGVLEDGKGRR